MPASTQPLFSLTAHHFLKRVDRANLIDGKHSALSGPPCDIEDPSTGNVIATIAEASAQDVDRAVSSAKQSFDDGRWRDLPAAKREQVLHRLADLIDANKDELAEIEAIDSGKPLAHARDIDLAEAVAELRYIAGWPSRLNGLSLPTAGRSSALIQASTSYEAIGVAALITPWNSPFLMAILKLAPALAAGCSVVLKPAEQTPLSTLRLGELIADAGIADGVVNIIHGGPKTGEFLTGHQCIDTIAFTGSTATGKAIAHHAADRLLPVTLELGGKAPVIIMADADPVKAAEGAARAAFFNNGQSCVAGTRLYVHETLVDIVTSKIIEIANGLQTGPSLCPRSDLGPLISSAHRDKVLSLLNDAQQAGARLETGGQIIGENGYFLKPAVLTHVHERMRIMRDEIFGPVITITAFRDTDDVVHMANDTPYGLAASVWTNDVSTMHRMSRQIRAGIIWGNCHGVFDPALPFGGLKQSGIGREQGLNGILNYMEHKTIAIALTPPR